MTINAVTCPTCDDQLPEVGLNECGPDLQADGFIGLLLARPGNPFATIEDPAGEFAQILREGTTFELRRSTETEGEGEDPLLFFDGETEENSPPLLPDRLEPVFSQPYTNLRQALDFLSQRDNMAETAAVVGPPTPEQQQRAELSPLNRQFVDVLTYHEQRQALLRGALLEDS